MGKLDKIIAIVKERYLQQYPSWTDIRVTESISNYDNSYYMVVKAKENGVDTEDEICFISNENNVSIFFSTEEFIRFVGNRQNKEWYKQLFSKTGISAIVTIVLL